MVVLTSDILFFFAQYKEYEEVVVDHRAMKERQRMKLEQEARENKAATKVKPSACSYRMDCDQYFN